MSDTRTADDVFGKRYGEVLLVHLGQSAPLATVYNTFPLNDCPQELWSKLDAEAIARENNAQLALLNGPRYWLMSSIEKVAQGEPVRKSFGGIDMIRQATVELSSLNPAPYVDPTPSPADLPALAARLTLPSGWRYQPRTPSSAIRVDTSTTDAQVIQDDLANSYSLQTS
jgi:hypothetical protein